jgi:hypothetical protein
MRADSVHAPFFEKSAGLALPYGVRGSVAACDVPRGTTMNASSNPQAAAGPRRKNYRDLTNPDTMGFTGTVTAIMALASFALLAAIILGMI